MRLSEPARFSRRLHRGPTWRLLRYARPYHRWMVLALLLILIQAGLVNFIPVLIKRITDTCLVAADRPLSARLGDLNRLGLLTLALAAVGYSIRYGQSLLTTWLGQRIIYDLRLDVFRKTMRLPLAHFDRTPVGALLTRVTSDIDRMQAFVTDGVVGTLADTFMLISIMVYMLVINVRVALALFAVLPLLFAALVLVNRRLRGANRAIRERQSSLNALLQEDLAGMTTIQLFNRQALAQQEFRQKNADLRAAHFTEVRWFSLYFPVIEAAQGLAFVLILGTGGWLLLAGSGWITLGVLVAFLAYVRDFFRPLGSLSDKAGTFQTAMASAERLFSLLDEPEPIRDPATPRPPADIQPPVAFEGVWFAYEAQQWVLRDVSFQIPAGQSVAVVGATGAGKSTLANLIARFYDVQRGRITFNGHDIRDFRQHDLRRQLGVVFQEPFLFAGTVYDNIALGNEHVTRDQVIEAARLVNAHAFISALPRGYDTVLNERGAGLSLGQKQLLCMARTVAQNPPLLLILDEATASVDTGTEQLIQEALTRLMHQRTSLVIAHRLSTIRHADRILVMRHGRLVDSGTHEELMQRGGYYRQLYQWLQHEPNA